MNNINEIIHKLIDDPKSMAIWSEILINPRITAKSIENTLNIGKSILYTRLNNLEQNNVIVSETIEKQTEKKSRVFENVFSISQKFIDAYKEKIESIKIEYVRDYRLFYLYFINSIIQREIRILSKKSNEEVRKVIQEEKHLFGSFMSFNDEEHEIAQKKVQKVITDIRNSTKIRKQSKQNTKQLVEGKFLMFFGFINLNENY
jgi:hypothetical protein